jgi:glycerol-3-phosphate dehydrogenase (NAD(P)+)
MTTIAIVGAGMMGTALCWPLSDNHHHVRLVGSPLDEDIITTLRAGGEHMRLKRAVPKGVTPYSHNQLAEALDGVDVIVSGVSSFGVDWFSQAVGPLLKPEVPVIAVTKGLEDLPNGDLITMPDATNRRLPAALQGKISLNAIGGPCIAHELAARRQTCVVFTGRDLQTLEYLKSLFATPYYHIWPSTDLTGVEVCAAMKNGYALGVGLGVGMMDKTGPDGLANMYNPQAALFAQGVLEMRRLLKIIGGGLDNSIWLPGPGDLYVTVFGGRTVKLGRLLGQGLSFSEARRQLAGETLESVEIIQRVARALPKLTARGLCKVEDFPLLNYVLRLIHEETAGAIPWQDFFGQPPF